MELLIKLFQNGELPQLAQWLLLLNIIDVATGFIKGIDTKSLSSSVMKHGALTKLIIWFVVLVSGVISSYFNTDLTSYVIGYYLIMEIVSIFENVSTFVSIPDKLKQVLNVNNVKTTSSTTTDESDESKTTTKVVKEDSRIFEEIKKMEEK